MDDLCRYMNCVHLLVYVDDYCNVPLHHRLEEDSYDSPSKEHES